MSPRSDAPVYNTRSDVGRQWYGFVPCRGSDIACATRTSGQRSTQPVHLSPIVTVVSRSFTSPRPGRRSTARGARNLADRSGDADRARRVGERAPEKADEAEEDRDQRTATRPRERDPRLDRRRREPEPRPVGHRRRDRRRRAQAASSPSSSARARTRSPSSPRSCAASRRSSDRARPVVVYSDSAYSIGLLTQGWKAKANVELVDEAPRAVPRVQGPAVRQGRRPRRHPAQRARRSAGDRRDPARPLASSLLALRLGGDLGERHELPAARRPRRARDRGARACRRSGSAGRAGARRARRGCRPSRRRRSRCRGARS